MGGSRLLVFLLVVLAAILLARYGALGPDDGETQHSRFEDSATRPALAQVRPPPLLSDPALPADRSICLDLKNIVCPSGCGEKEDGTRYEWNRILIGFCSESCIESFTEHPEECLTQTDLQWAAEADMLRRIDVAPDEELGGLFREAKRRFNVVEKPQSE